MDYIFITKIIYLYGISAMKNMRYIKNGLFNGKSKQKYSEARSELIHMYIKAY